MKSRQSSSSSCSMPPSSTPSSNRCCCSDGGVSGDPPPPARASCGSAGRIFSTCSFQSSATGFVLGFALLPSQPVRERKNSCFKRSSSSRSLRLRCTSSAKLPRLISAASLFCWPLSASIKALSSFSRATSARFSAQLSANSSLSKVRALKVEFNVARNWPSRRASARLPGSYRLLSPWLNSWTESCIKGLACICCMVRSRRPRKAAESCSKYCRCSPSMLSVSAFLCRARLSASRADSS
mmetsp:Transcript_145305/g.368730  ORF Transcript_145305/g.368730 Transcript_145305/m.368730 type:complete len:240 (-) Transcript_145305:226-945(-)